MRKSYIRKDKTTPVEETEKLENGEWVRLEAPSAEELADVAQKFGLDESLLKDVLDPFEAPRFEMADGNVYIYLRYAFSKAPLGTAPLLIVLTKEAIITIAPGTPSFLERFENGTVHFSTTNRVELLIHFIAEVTARYTTTVTRIRRAVNGRKQQIPEMTEQDIIDFATYEVALNSFIDALVPQLSVLSKIAAGKTIPTTEEEHEFAEDALLSTTQLIDLSRTILETVKSVREAHAAISTQQLNKVIRMLTGLTVLVTIPNVITGFYGMNVHLPGSDSPLAAVFILLTVGAVTGITAMLFIRNKWF